MLSASEEAVLRLNPQTFSHNPQSTHLELSTDGYRNPMPSGFIVMAPCGQMLSQAVQPQQYSSWCLSLEYISFAVSIYLELNFLANMLPEESRISRSSGELPQTWGLPLVQSIVSPPDVNPVLQEENPPFGFFPWPWQRRHRGFLVEKDIDVRSLMIKQADLHLEYVIVPVGYYEEGVSHLVLDLTDPEFCDMKGNAQYLNSISWQPIMPAKVE